MQQKICVFKNREREREREREIVHPCMCEFRKDKRIVERNNIKSKKIDYLNKIDCRIDELMWAILRSECVK